MLTAPQKAHEMALFFWNVWKRKTKVEKILSKINTAVQ